MTRPNDGPERADRALTVAAVVPARNAAETLPACLAGLAAAGFGAGEVVVVDDGSTDRTAELARAAGARVVPGEGAGAAAARNLGAAAAAADILLFVDADVVAKPDARERVLRFFADHPGHSAVFGAYCDAPPAPGLVSRARNLLHRHVHRAGAGEAETFWTGLGAVRRDDFEAVGGFDPAQRMMEDVALGMALRRAGHRIRIDPALEGTHLKRWTLASMVRTDLLDRAVPWSRLILTGGAGDTLNVSPEGRRSVLAAGGAAAALCVLPFAPPLAAAGLVVGAVGLVQANRAFLGGLRRERGLGFAAGATGMLWAHYLAGGLGYAWVRLVERPRPGPSLRADARPSAHAGAHSAAMLSDRCPPSTEESRSNSS